jgi:hypothetical protein
MRITSLAAALCCLVIGAAPAAAQVDIGGSVPSMLQLTIDEPDGFASFPAGPGEHELAIRTRVTSTANRATLSAVDGDVTSGRRLGHLAGSGSVLDQPLEARVGSDPFQPLDVSLDPVLAEFRSPVANERATIRLRQRIEAGERPRGTYAKTLLITLSSTAP